MNGKTAEGMQGRRSRPQNAGNSAAKQATRVDNQEVGS
jgi:hypothetical protein